MQNSSFNNFLSEGKLNIFNEDALDFLPKLENESIDLIYCDLPFGTTQCSWDEVIPFDKMWEQVIRVTKQNTPIIFHAQQPFTSALIMSNPKMFKTEVYGKVKQDVIGGGETDRYPRSVQVFASDKQKTKLDGTIHPTQKPLALLEMLVKSYTDENDIVLDNTCGSGTTNLACLKLNRKSIGIEKEKQYYDVAVRRLSSYCG